MKFRTLLWAALILLPGFGGAAAASDADAMYIEILEEYTLLEDGGVVQRHEHRLEYLTPFAFSRILGETFILYNPEHQSLEIESAVTVTPDGAEVEPTPNSFNEILPSFCADAPNYMHLREMVVTHLGLDVGAVTHVRHRGPGAIAQVGRDAPQSVGQGEARPARPERGVIRHDFVAEPELSGTGNASKMPGQGELGVRCVPGPVLADELRQVLPGKTREVKRDLPELPEAGTDGFQPVEIHENRGGPGQLRHVGDPSGA